MGFELAALLAMAAFCSGALAYLLHPLLVRYALARPNARSSHREPTPQGGGIAVIGAVAIVLVGAVMLMPSHFPDIFRISILLACAIALAAVGAFDDIRQLGALPRLALQTIVVLVVVADLPTGFRILPIIPWWIERGLLVVSFVWFVNLVNFMDGIDWMTVVEVVPIAATLAIFGLMGAIPVYATAVSIALCGAMIGFAPFNKPVARLFLGDVGSLPIGLILAWLLVLLAQGHLAASILLPLYYVLDATITLLRRLFNRERLTQAHRHHYYQRALDSGHSVYHIVGCVFSVNIALAGFGFITLVQASLLVHLLLLAAGAALVGMLLWHFREKYQEPQPDGI
jgi:UDP-N-acetylmuramyl pentapeptide phosphotransferase/UDP-N-acetylglucosamine-1-phosphate transferase